MLAGRSLSSWRASAGRARPLALLACAAVIASLGPVGCDHAGARSDSSPPPVRARRTLGEVGLEPGQVLTPRAIDSDARYLWVIDKSGRVQRLAPDGKPLGAFTLPSVARGYPVGITCGPDGLVYIADTHEHRVLVCRPLPAAGPASPALEEVARWGAYGTAAGEFIYTTDVAIIPGPDGRTAERIYVGEYGGNDRVSVFDADRTFLFSFGRAGSSADPGRVEFDRPQSLLYDPARRVLFVADSSNHRIGVFTPDGALVKWIGKAGIEDGASRPGAGGPGRAPGEFNYPYGLAILPDGTLLVSELGNGRVQRIDPDSGRSLSIVGRPGRGAGELAEPWGITLLDGLAYVLDTGNHRILAFDPGQGGGG
jgi:DNA-binding beta-propeller fold protein YncE